MNCPRCERGTCDFHGNTERIYLASVRGCVYSVLGIMALIVVANLLLWLFTVRG